MDVSLRIVYESEGAGKALTAAKVTNQRLLIEAATAAVAEAYERAEAVAEVDSFLGDVHREEADRLARVLGMLIPELRSNPQLRLVKVNTAPEGDDAKDDSGTALQTPPRDQ